MSLHNRFSRCGTGVPVAPSQLDNFLVLGRLGENLSASVAKSGRPITRAGIRDFILATVRSEKRIEHAKIAEFMAGGRVDTSNLTPSVWLTNALLNALPGFAAELSSCKSGEEFKALFDRRAKDIGAYFETVSAANSCKARADEMLLDEFVKATGFDREKLRGQLPLRAFKSPMDVQAVAVALKETIVAIANAGVEALGENEWLKLGVDGQQPFGAIVFLCAFAKDPDAAAVIGRNAAALDEALQNLFGIREQMAAGLLTSVLPAAKAVAEAN